ncbi:MoxR-like ATPase [Natranaerovirga pectinivora]|uniref:MoxR-like ATPase n=1 Tax=Natranaerovirga pectinivora TaxID=682400 RepID=A0A4R3MDT0_9FIRM|nr:AAA family ATPase [Natranaerovirga pectinivora]TCT11606.1 MoxR-like ATPase [Natranaerovirga pectinivora]
MNLDKIKVTVDGIKANIQKVIIGKDDIIDLLIISLISSSHVLLEDVPGTGKTLLAKSLAKSVDCSFKRIQFTPDLLPSDVTGINFYNQKNSEFEFRPGPIFTNILLADEINRATPRTQSSLLEAMEEKQVTIDGVTKILEKPFMVIATQNPIETGGTFPLPEAQLDRFLFKINMGYPTFDEGFNILKRFKENNPMEELKSVAMIENIIEASHLYPKVHISDEIMKYIMEIVEMTRKHENIVLGVSPRGSQALLKATMIYAIIQGRDYVLPDDVKKMSKAVLAHRLVLKRTLKIQGESAEMIIDSILKKIIVPTEYKLVQGMRK